MKLLSKTLDLQREVVRLMKPGAERIVLCAFIGKGATAYIPKPEGVTIVCWPKAGGTNPRAVRELMEQRAKVFFADRLHMKIFWARGRGAVIGSANLTTNALGSGNLKELAVAVPASSVPIHALLKSVGARKVTDKKLKLLDREHQKMGRFVAGGELPMIHYRTWFNSPSRPRWKFGWWDERVDYSAVAVKHAKSEFNKAPRASIVATKEDFRDYDWILSFGLTAKGAKEPEWIFVDFVVRSTNSKKERFPYEAVQVLSNHERPTPPFSLAGGFGKALSIACRSFGIEKLKSLKAVRPPETLLRLIGNAMPPAQKKKKP